MPYVPPGLSKFLEGAALPVCAFPGVCKYMREHVLESATRD